MASTVEEYKQQLQLQQENHDVQISEVMAKLQETELQAQQVHGERIVLVHRRILVFGGVFFFSFSFRGVCLKILVYGNCSNSVEFHHLWLTILAFEIICVVIHLRHTFSSLKRKGTQTIV